MTQALINTLNILPEKTVNMAEKMPKTEGLEFGKIFETKTNESNQTTDENETVMNSEVRITDDNGAQHQIIKNDDNLTDKKDTTTQTVTIQNQESDINQAIQTFVQVDSTLADALINADDENTENIIIDDLNINEELITDENTNEEATITEEVPTMYKELNTLEDPTAVLLLQSQIQKNVKTTLETEEENENASITLKNNNQPNTNSTGTSIFKQFDNPTSKDVSLVNLAPKENTYSKGEGQKTSNVISENIVKELNVEVVSSQASEAESSMGDLMQNQSPQEQATRVMIQGDIKYESVEQEIVKTTTQVKTTNITPSKIVEQISKQLEGMFNNSKLNMVLSPGTLGKVSLQLINAKEGLLAQFTVTTQEAKDLLMKGLDGLKESLLAQGVSVDSLSVKLEENDAENLFDWTEQEGSRGGYKQQQAKKQKENEQNFEKMMFDIENKDNV